MIYMNIYVEKRCVFEVIQFKLICVIYDYIFNFNWFMNIKML